jgi:ABC-type transport system substrate-binding protein
MASRRNKDAFAAVLTRSHELAPKYKARGLELEKLVMPNTFFLSFNMQDPVIGKNVKLRKALSCAYDCATYSEIFYSGVAPVAQQLLPRGFSDTIRIAKTERLRLEKAKRLLAEAGYPNGRDATRANSSRSPSRSRRWQRDAAARENIADGMFESSASRSG